MKTNLNYYLMSIFFLFFSALAMAEATQYRDASVLRRDDFYKHANAKWLQKNASASNQKPNGVYVEAIESMNARLDTCVENLLGKDTQISNMYSSIMASNFQSVNLKLQEQFVDIDKIKDIREIPGLIAQLNKLGVNIFSMEIIPAESGNKVFVDAFEDKRPEYYTSDRATHILRDTSGGVMHILRMFDINIDKSVAEKIVNLDSEIYKYKKEQNNQQYVVYKPNIVKSRSTKDWNKYFENAGLTNKVGLVYFGSESFLAFDKLLDSQPLDVWKVYFKFRFLIAYKKVALSDPNISQKLHAIRVVRDIFSDAKLKRICFKKDVEDNQAKLMAIFLNVASAYKEMIDTMDLSSQTKKKLKDKVDTMFPLIGAPGAPKGFSRLKISDNDAVGNLMIINENDYQNTINEIGKTVPSEMANYLLKQQDATYDSKLNVVAIPVIFTIPPFFTNTGNSDYDNALNYGAIGVIIGHEISHSLDDQSLQYDGTGKIDDNWINNRDHNKLVELRDQLAKQYKSYYYNENDTNKEDVADNLGLYVAYNAYKKSLGGNSFPILKGRFSEEQSFSGDQLFYYSFAEIWRNTDNIWAKEDYSPNAIRVNGSLRNQPGFYKAFRVQNTNHMYLPEAERWSVTNKLEEAKEQPK